MITLDFDFTPQDQAELLKYFEEESVMPGVFSWEVPQGTLKFVVNSIDFSNYHKANGRTSLVEFAVSFKSCLARAGSDVRSIVFHMEYGFELEVYRFNPQTYTIRDRRDNRVDVDVQSMQDAMHQFCLRLYKAAIEPNLPIFDCIKSEYCHPSLDDWIAVLLTPVCDLDEKTSMHFISIAQNYSPPSHHK